MLHQAKLLTTDLGAESGRAIQGAAVFPRTSADCGWYESKGWIIDDER